jgi:biotin operon repressor
VSTFRSANGIRRAAPCTNGIPSKIAERERNRAAILTAVSELCESDDGVSYDQLQGHPGLNKKTVWRHVRHLREAGLAEISYRRLQGRRVAVIWPLQAR